MKNLSKILMVLCLLMLAGCLLVFAGCSTTSVENRGVDENGRSRGWCVTRRSNMVKQDLTDFEASINPDGTIGVKFGSYAAAPSEEFAKSLMTFAYVARIAAAMYSPGAATVPLSSEAADPQAIASVIAAQSAAQTAKIKAKAAARPVAAASPVAADTSAACADGSCND